MSTKQFQVQWLLIMLDIKWLISELSPDILIVLFYSTPLLGSAVILILTHWGFAGRIWDFLFGVWLDLDSTGPAQFVLSKAILTLGMFTVSPSVAKNVCLFLFIAVSTATSCFFLFFPLSAHYSDHSYFCFPLCDLCLSHPVVNRCICLSPDEFITLKCLHSPRGPPAS